MKILVLGTGMMAHGAVHDLVKQKQVTTVGIGSRDPKKAKKKFAANKKLKFEKVDVTKDVSKVLKKYDAVISCVPYNFNLNLAQCAIKAKTHFIDLGGNNTIVKKELALNKQAKEANITILPDCGLAPGLVNLISAKALKELGGKADRIEIRVGGLPQKPKGGLKYEQVFSIHGLINEYKEMSEIIENHKKRLIESLTEIEKLKFPGFRELEAFHTSGGASTLTTTMQKMVKNLNYKTIRFPGHAEMMQTFKEMGYFEEPLRKDFEKLLHKTLPKGAKDQVLVKVTAQKGKKKVTYRIHDKAQGKLTAMMRCTAFPASIIAQMAAQGKLKPGAHAQEKIVPLDEFFKELKKRNIELKRSTK